MYEFRRQKVEKPAEDSDQPPMALPPSVVGILYRQKVTPREIAATIIDLAIRGDIYILDRERDFAFSKNTYFIKSTLLFMKLVNSAPFNNPCDNNAKSAKFLTCFPCLSVSNSFNKD